MGGRGSGRRLGARPPPSELARQLLLDLESAVRPHIEQDWGGQDVLGTMRLAREQLVEALEPARWRTNGRDNT